MVAIREGVMSSGRRVQAAANKFSGRVYGFNPTEHSALEDCVYCAGKSAVVTARMPWEFYDRVETDEEYKAYERLFTDRASLSSHRVG